MSDDLKISIVNFRVTKDEKKAIMVASARSPEGNVSDFIKKIVLNNASVLNEIKALKSTDHDKARI